MLRVAPSKEIRISLYVAAALTLVLGYADLWRGGTTVSAFLLAIGYCAMIPLVIWSGVLGEKDPREIDKPEYRTFRRAGLWAAADSIAYWTRRNALAAFDIGRGDLDGFFHHDIADGLGNDLQHIQNWDTASHE